MSVWEKKREALQRKGERQSNIYTGTMLLTAFLAVLLCGYMTKYANDRELEKMMLLKKEMQKQK